MAPERDSAPLTMVDALAQLSFLIQGTLERHAAAHGLSPAQTRLLGILRDRRPTMRELAELLGLDKSSVTGLVDRAERRGLVVRRPSANDGRAVTVELSAPGRRLVERTAEAFGDELRGLLEALGPRERARLGELAGRVVVAHAAEHGIRLD